MKKRKRETTGRERERTEDEKIYEDMYITHTYNDSYIYMDVLEKTITERKKHHDTLLEDMDNSNIILCHMIWIIPLSHTQKKTKI